MGDSYSFRFTVGDDDESPSLDAVDALDGSGAVVANMVRDDLMDEIVTENAGWESGWRLRLRFSEPVTMRTLEARVICEGGPAMILETTGDESSVAVFRFGERPTFGSTFTVRLHPGIEDIHGNAMESDVAIRIVADGVGSTPPRLVGIRLPLAPGEADADDREYTAFAIDSPYATIDLGRYDIGVPTETSIELYICLASGSSLDPLSIMSSFSLSSTNSSLDFSAEAVSLDAIFDAPSFVLWQPCAVATVHGTMTNNVDSGVATVQLAAGFNDSEGNTAAEVQRLPLLK